jgi:DNA-binding NtrC family response regulator
LDLLQSYPWPGNVRELRNIVHRAYVMTEGKTIRPEVVQSLLPKTERAAAASGPKRKPPQKPVRAVATSRKK